VPDDKAYACIHVFSTTRPVLYVCRQDGDLVLTCGGRDHEQSADDWKVIHSGHLVDLDPSLAGAVTVANGEQVERTAIDKPWVSAPLEE
jgi:hypothetical protein